MTDIAIPAAVDVTAQSGRRVRTPDGALLPAGYVLRGEPRSIYWIRAEQDGDVRLAPHQPEAAEPAAIEPAPAEPPMPEPAAEKPGRSKA